MGDRFPQRVCQKSDFRPQGPWMMLDPSLPPGVENSVDWMIKGIGKGREELSRKRRLTWSTQLKGQVENQVTLSARVGFLIKIFSWNFSCVISTVCLLIHVIGSINWGLKGPTLFVIIVVLVFMAFLFSYCFVDCKYHLTDDCWSEQTYHETGLFQVLNTSIFWLYILGTLVFPVSMCLGLGLYGELSLF